jgi:hypothetical protein
MTGWLNKILPFQKKNVALPFVGTISVENGITVTQI